MGRDDKTITRTRQETFDGEGQEGYKIEEYEVELDTCDHCGCDERGIDGEWRVMYDVPVQRGPAAVFRGVSVALHALNEEQHKVATVFESPLGGLMRGDITRRGGFPFRDAEFYALEVRGWQWGNSDEEFIEQLFCPHCYDALFGE